MIKLTLFAIALLGSFALQASNDIPTDIHLGSVVHACHIAHHSNDANKVNCLKNAQSMIHADLKKLYKVLGKRDLTHVLNTKAVELQILKNNCSSLPVSLVVKVDCEIQSDLSLLHYIEDRYGSN